MTSTRTIVILGLVVGLGAGLRSVGLAKAGVIYQDDLRAYSGLALRDALLSQSRLTSRLRSAYEISISETGAKPSLAWLMAGAAAVGAHSIGQLYFPIAILGVATLLGVALLAARLGDLRAGGLASGWLAVSSAHIAYSRSALTVVPGSLAFVIGLILCTDRGGALVSSKGRWIWAGVAWAAMTSFHPAYIVFLSVPFALLLLQMLQQRMRPRDAALFALAAVTPSVILPLLYDAPAALRALTTGGLALDNLRYLSALGSLGGSTTIRGDHEGLGFFPRFLFEAEGVMTAFFLTFALVGLATARTDRALVAAWIIIPMVLWAVAPGLRSQGRLFGPLLPAVAVLIGVGLTRLAARHHRSTVILLACGFLMIGNGTFRAIRLARAEGFEPRLAARITANQASQAMGLVRTDVHSLPFLRAGDLLYEPADVRRAICDQGKRFLILSPASFYLVVRHWRFFTQDMELVPVTVFKNPYKRAFRLMEGHGLTPDDRTVVLESPRMSELGLFRVARLDGCALTGACC